MRLPTLALLWATFLLGLSLAWSAEDHEIFRLRDEVHAAEGNNVTFYDFVGVKPSATKLDIEKALRKRSREIHPDKAKQSYLASYSASVAAKSGGASATSKASSSKSSKKTASSTAKGKNTKPKHKSTVPTKKFRPSSRDMSDFDKHANARYARLSVVANILTSPERERYDHFLKNGFPLWRGTGYYYSRIRPGVGTVLVGLVIAFGGFAHYGALYLSWKRQRDFVERYIKYARRTAWGDESGIAGLSNVGSETRVEEVTEEDAAPQEGGQLNRKQRRQQEKDAKKASSKGNAKGPDPKNADISEPNDARIISGPARTKKRVVAENGKVLVVDSAGNVFLEEETEDGEKQEYLLDVNEIPPPSLRDTVLFRLPGWVYRKATGKSNPVTEHPDDDDVLVEGVSKSAEKTLSDAAAVNPVAEMKRRRGKGR